MNKPIGVGLIGYGFSGQVFHAPLILSTVGLRLEAVASLSGSEARQKLPSDVKVVEHAEELFTDPAISLVVVATPNRTHASMVQIALQSGKHVVVDKPFMVSTEEAEACISLAKRQGLLLSVFHNRRWDTDFLTVQQVIAEGKLGRVVEFESHFDRFTPEIDHQDWRNQDEPGSGILYDLGPHLIDQALLLFGQPLTVFADIRRQRAGAPTDDYFELILDFGEIKAILKSSCLVREPGPRFIVHGTAGSFVKYGIDPQEKALSSGISPLEQDWGKEPSSDWGLLNTIHTGVPTIGRVESVPGNYPYYYAGIRDALLKNERPPIKPEEALQVMYVIEAALESSRTRRVVVLR
ncbi:MAG: oxidoreductase [Gorillibacterium sp.]|nr:oxidoreductase [Gorillibacterium sp.]